MRRRECIALVVGMPLAIAIDANAQMPARMRRIGVLMNGVAANETAQSYAQTFVQGLNNSGWTERTEPSH